MDRQQIVNRVNGLRTKHDLLSLLNDLKAEELGDKAFPFTMWQLNYYCNPNRTKHRYHNFEIPKKSGGKRQITAPVKALKSLLRYVNVIFQAMYEPMPCVMGFTPGRSVADNAKAHTGKHYVFNIDLEDFFPSVAQARVWAKLQLAPFGFTNSEDKDGPQRRFIADMLAGMCCMKIDAKSNATLYAKMKQRACNAGKEALFVLPQGAPTSPVLTNIICERLDRQLTRLARHYGLTYTRYADDITFSSMHNVFQEGSEFRKRLAKIIGGQNFVMNPKKTRLSRTYQRQEVTGLTVNEKPNVARKYVQDVRHILHTWETKGYNAAFAEFYPHYKAERPLKKGNPNLENVISGKLEYLKMVKGPDDSTYAKLNARYEALITQRDEGAVQFAASDLRYIKSCEVPAFEASLHAKIETAQAKDGKAYAYFVQNGRKQLVSVSSKLNIANLEELKPKVVISLCETAKGKRFWLIHNPVDGGKTDEKNDSYLSDLLSKLVSSNFNLEILSADGTK